MSRLVLIALTTLCVLSTQTAFAETLKHAKAEVQVTPPQSWVKETLKTGDLRITAPDKLVAINLIRLDKGDVKEAIKGVLEKRCFILMLKLI